MFTSLTTFRDALLAAANTWISLSPTGSNWFPALSPLSYGIVLMTPTCAPIPATPPPAPLVPETLLAPESEPESESESEPAAEPTEPATPAPAPAVPVTTPKTHRSKRSRVSDIPSILSLMDQEESFWFAIFDRSERAGISIEHQFYHMRQFSLRNDHPVAYGLFIRWARTRGVFDLPGPSFLPHLRVRPEAKFISTRWNGRPPVEASVDTLYTRANLLRTKNGIATDMNPTGHPLPHIMEVNEDADD